MRCEECGHEYLLAFSCKRRHFCPSCHQKRVVEFGEWLCEEVLKVDPLTCPKCQGRMRIISFIENEEVIKKILKHLGLWDVKARPPPRANAPPKHEPYINYSLRGVGPYGPEADSQLLVPACHLSGESDKWLYAEGPDFSGIDPKYPVTYTR